MTAPEQRSKRVVELAVIAAAAPIVLPIAALCALAIRFESPGPIVFSQMRTGQHARPIRVYKFRTMVRNAEELKAELQHLNVLKPPDFKIPNDPRVTRVGRFLRATSLDELPQLWNVVRGEMAIVGPRPTSFSAETYQLWHTRRLEARPGLTGLWQISGRHTTTFDDRVRLDEQYIRRRSVGFDVKVMLRTIPALIRREGM